MSAPQEFPPPLLSSRAPEADQVPLAPPGPRLPAANPVLPKVPSARPSLLVAQGVEPAEEVSSTPAVEPVGAREPREPGRIGRVLTTVGLFVVLFAGAGAIYRIVQRTTQDSPSANAAHATDTTPPDSTAPEPTLVLTVPASVAPAPTVSHVTEGPFRFDLPTPVTPQRGTASSVAPGATTVSWEHTSSAGTTVVNLITLPTTLSAAEANVNAAQRAINISRASKGSVTDRKEVPVPRGLGRYYKVVGGDAVTHFVYVAVVGRTEVVIVGTSSTGRPPAAYLLARSTATLGTARVG